MIKTYYYSVSNCGDRSVYPIFFEDEDCAEVHQELQEEGWGEDCTGKIDIETSIDCEVKLIEAYTREDYLEELRGYVDDIGEPQNSSQYNRLKQLKEAIEALEALDPAATLETAHYLIVTRYTCYGEKGTSKAAGVELNVDILNEDELVKEEDEDSNYRHAATDGYPCVVETVEHVKLTEEQYKRYSEIIDAYNDLFLLLK